MRTYGSGNSLLRMMMILLLPALLTGQLPGQEAGAELTTLWSLFYGGADNEEVNSIVLTDSEGCLIAGMTESYGFGVFGKPDMWILELDPDGGVLWEETYGVADCFETVYHLIETGDGGYLAAGYKCGQWGFGGGDAILLKIDSLGTEEWFQQFGGSEDDGIRFIQASPAGGYIACGWTRSSGAGFVDAWVVKLDAGGNIEWAETFGGTDYDVAKTVYSHPDGGYFVTGYTNSQGAGEYDAWVLKLDVDGNLEWEKTYGDTGYDRVYHSAPCLDSTYVLTGLFDNGSECDLWVFRIDSQGDVIWDRTYDHAADDEGHWIEETSDGGFAIAAWAGYEGNPWTEMWILRLDTAGVLLWDSTYGGPASDVANVVRQVNEYDYLLGGSTLSFGGGRVDMWLMKLHDNPTGIEDDPPAPVSLFECRPNPCSQGAAFILDQKYDGPVSIRVFDLAGRLVSTVHDGYLPAGRQSIVFDGATLSTGVYYARLVTGESVCLEKVVFIE